ncbi:MAG: hypothetical protein R2854_28225 [Caldilineaceae bacterium]
MEETWYQRLYDWCSAHGAALTGHPARADDMGAERYFHMPGQDLVWRWVLLDDPTAGRPGVDPGQVRACLGGAAPRSHAQRQRMLRRIRPRADVGRDELAGALVLCARRQPAHSPRVLLPVRGIRRDERPPDVGPNSPWWDRYRAYADSSRRLSWLNTDCEHQCDIAILGEADFLPWRWPRLLQHQRDFNYVARGSVERA